MGTITISPGANIQKAINAAPAGTTIVFKAGVYDVSRVINLKSGVSLQGEAGAKLQSNGKAGIFQGLGVHDVNISGFTFDGKNGGPSNSGAIYLDSSTGGGSGTPSNNIHITNNTFQNWTNNSGSNLWLWHTQNTYVQGNTFKNGWEAVGWSTDKGAPPMNNLVVSNNVITGMKYIGIETAFDSTVSNVHIDYNKISNIGDMSISFVEGETGGKVMSGTVKGNQIDGANSGGTLVELGNYNGPFNVTVSDNVLSNHEWGMMFSHTAGMAVLNNKFVNVENPFSDDGGYDGTEWIGTNTVDGAKQVGWPGHNYGPQPALYSSPNTGSYVAANESQYQMASAIGASAVASSETTSPQGVTTTGTVDVSAKGTADLPAVSGDTPSLQPAAKTGTVALPTQGTPELPASGIADVPVVPIQPSTLLGNLGTSTDFSQGGASLGQDPAGGAFSGTLDRDGAGIPHEPVGGSLAADLTNIGRLGEMTIVGDSRAGISIQPQPANVGTAFSSLDQGVKQPDALNPDMWRHA
jgi:hypothetical protein